MKNIHHRVGRGSATVAALVVALLGTVAAPRLAEAEAGSCQSSNTGCVRHYEVTTSHYRFDVSDPDLYNNHFNGTGTALDYSRVKGNLGAMRLNSSSINLMCIYANMDYQNPLYWVFSKNAWYSTNRAGWSLRYRTGTTC